MLRKALWLGALLVTVLLVALLVNAEGLYIKLVRSLDDVETWMTLVGVEEQERKVVIHFEVLFHNTSEVSMWVEAINTQLYINGEYAGAHSITEGNIEIPPQEKKAVPLEAHLWSARKQLLEQAQLSQSGAQLGIIGRARVRIEVGRVALKTFYQVGGSFSLGKGGEQ